MLGGVRLYRSAAMGNQHCRRHVLVFSNERTALPLEENCNLLYLLQYDSSFGGRHLVYT